VVRSVDELDGARRDRRAEDALARLRKLRGGRCILLGFSVESAQCRDLRQGASPSHRAENCGKTDNTFALTPSEQGGTVWICVQREADSIWSRAVLLHHHGDLRRARAILNSNGVHNDPSHKLRIEPASWPAAYRAVRARVSRACCNAASVPDCRWEGFTSDDLSRAGGRTPEPPSVPPSPAGRRPRSKQVRMASRPQAAVAPVLPRLHKASGGVHAR